MRYMIDGFTADTAESALALLGDVLAARRQRHEIVIIGGTCLLMTHVTTRVTRDVDVVAGLENGELVRLQALPASLADAATDVARQLELPSNWLNTGPAGMTEGADLPEGFLTRTERREFNGLMVHLAGRADMIAFKVYAAADHFGDAANKHLGDLELLAPTPDELAFASAWCREQDTSMAFATLLDATLADLERRRVE